VENLAFEIFAATDLSAVFTKLLNILSVVLGLGLVIFFHELGHFAVAKWCNVHVERFSIGIGPILWSRQKGETEYALSALPFGGYVKMLGQDDMDPNQMTSSEIAENPRSYSAKSVPQRMAIISAGVIMNVITGFLFFSTCYFFGVYEPSPVVGSVIPGFPAWQAGIRPGDRITAINGEAIRSFSDLQEAVILSSGDVALEGMHDDGTSFSEVLTPLKSSPGRSVGIRPGATTAIADIIEKPELISDAGLPLEKASEEFLPGDKIIALRPSPLTTETPADAAAAVAEKPGDAVRPMLFSELRYVTARYADRELIYTVERHDKDAEGKKSKTAKTVEITVPPSEIRSIGLWMAMGPIKAIQKNSIAEKAGLKVGDLILSVDDKEPGKNIDPLELPVYFGKQAGKPVKVVVKRATSEGDDKVELEVIPGDTPGWLDSPDFKASPLSINAIGIGYQVQLRIARVLPGSEAEKLGVFKPDMKITRVDLIAPDPEKAVPDAFGDAMSPRQLDLSTMAPKEPGTLEDVNWAWAFAEIQRVPNRQIRIYFEDGKNTGSEVLKTYESATGWYRWFRGFNGSIWQDDRELQKGDSLGDALALGIRRTKKTAVSIYMTLRSLTQGNVSADSLSGPLGIAKIGYMVAERGLIDLLMFLGFLSINLAILNFLPIPILDGGHMVFLLWEGITRRKPSSRVIGWAHGVGLLFIISLFLFVMYVDISTLWGSGD
jgi:regulator of sigma E protease